MFHMLSPAKCFPALSPYESSDNPFDHYHHLFQMSKWRHRDERGQLAPGLMTRVCTLVDEFSGLPDGSSANAGDAT